MITDNLKIIEDTISQKCLETGRDRSEITLIAVSKTMPLEAIYEGIEAGILHFGENKAQEFKEKSLELKKQIIWHYIGHLQTNKVKYVINSADYIHSVDSVKLADEINRRANGIDKLQKVLIEANTSGEDVKYGVRSKDDLRSLLEHCKNSSNLAPVGLMTMAPYTEDVKIIRDCFKRLKEWQEEMNNHGIGLSELSMGMTNDYRIAIEEGATMLRIGTAIFGERNYNN